MTLAEPEPDLDGDASSDQSDQEDAEERGALAHASIFQFAHCLNFPDDADQPASQPSRRRRPLESNSERYDEPEPDEGPS